MGVVIVVGGLLAAIVLPNVRAGLANRLDAISTAVRRINPSYREIRPSATLATAQIANHPASLATNLVTNDYWAADTAGGRQPTLTVTFNAPTDLDYLLITPGAGRDYANLARPRTLHLTYSDGTGEDVDVPDDPRPSGHEIHARSITSVSMRVTRIWPSPRSTNVAIDEVEFFQLR
jgi:hypothetical protein